MATINESLSALMELDGAKAVALVDYSSGMLMGSQGGGIDLNLAAAGNTEVIKAKMSTMKLLGLPSGIKIVDILISLTDQYHLIRPLQKHSKVFLYYVLDLSKANLALARAKLELVEKDLEL